MSEKTSRGRLIGRVLGAVGLLLAVATGIVLVVGQDSPAGDVAGVESALARGTDPAVPGADDRTVATSGTTTVSTTATTKPERDEAPLATASQRPLSEVVATSRVPIRLAIGELGVDAPVEPYGVDVRTRQMDVPDNVRDVAWYEHGPVPGESGSAVLAAHVDLAGQGPGVFFNLKDMQPGDRIIVSFNDGTKENFTVQARETYDKDGLPLDVIFSREGPPVLTLITCGGGFSASSRSYDSNVVVYATPLRPAYGLGQS